MVRFVNVYHSPFKLLWAPLDCNSSTTPELNVLTSGYQMYGRMALACEISYSGDVVSYFIPLNNLACRRILFDIIFHFPAFVRNLSIRYPYLLLL